MLKRAGRGHDPAGAQGSPAGSLAVECAACPHPGRNLPDNWEDAPSDVMYVFALFVLAAVICIDCFVSQLAIYTLPYD